MKYLLNNPDVVFRLFIEHVGLTAIALIIAAMISLPLGWLLFYRKNLVGPVLGVLGVLYTVPSIALIILLIPLFGLNKRSVVIALIVYCQVILTRNTLVGLNGIDKSIIEAARGMGMNNFQIAIRIQLPLALPVILAGVRVAAVAAIAIATVGAKFGAGGLGTLLFDGIAQAGRTDKIILGALLVAVLAWIINFGLKRLEVRFAPQLHVATQSN